MDLNKSYKSLMVERHIVYDQECFSILLFTNQNNLPAAHRTMPSFNVDNQSSVMVYLTKYTLR